MQRRLLRIIIELDDGSKVTYGQYEFSRFSIREGNLEIWIDSVGLTDGHLKKVYAPGRWKDVEFVYE